EVMTGCSAAGLDAISLFAGFATRLGNGPSDHAAHRSASEPGQPLEFRENGYVVLLEIMRSARIVAMPKMTACAPASASEASSPSRGTNGRAASFGHTRAKK